MTTTAKNTISGKQRERQGMRDKRGRYEENPKCEYCGKSVPLGKHCSLETCNDDGIGVTLHAGCFDAMERWRALYYATKEMEKALQKNADKIIGGA